MDQVLIDRVAASITSLAADRLPNPGEEQTMDVINILAAARWNDRPEEAFRLAMLAGSIGPHTSWRAVLRMTEIAARALTVKQIRQVETHPVLLDYQDELGLGLFAAMRAIARETPDAGAVTHLAVRVLAPLIWHNTPIEDAGIWGLLLDRASHLLTLARSETVPLAGVAQTPGVALSWHRRVHIAFADMRAKPLATVPQT